MYGGMAYYINESHGFVLAIRAALAQGAACFLATLSSAWLTQFFFDLGKNSWQRCLFATFGSGSIMCALMVMIHVYNQTPEIINTVGARQCWLCLILSSFRCFCLSNTEHRLLFLLRLAYGLSLDPKLLGGLDYLVANFEGSLFPSEKKGLLAQPPRADILELIGHILPLEKMILSCANNHAAV